MNKTIGNLKVIAVLNTAHSMELYGIHQYMNQHYNLFNMDYTELAQKVKEIAKAEMKHSEMFAERIKVLDGEPGSDLADKVTLGQAVESIYPFDMNIESSTMDKYNEFIAG